MNLQKIAFSAPLVTAPGILNLLLHGMVPIW